MVGPTHPCQIRRDLLSARARETSEVSEVNAPVRRTDKRSSRHPHATRRDVATPLRPEDDPQQARTRLSSAGSATRCAGRRSYNTANAGTRRTKALAEAEVATSDELESRPESGRPSPSARRWRRQHPRRQMAAWVRSKRRAGARATFGDLPSREQDSPANQHDRGYEPYAVYKEARARLQARLRREE